MEPVSAATIATSESGLAAGPVRIPTADGEMPGYHARMRRWHGPPAQAGRTPAAWRSRAFAGAAGSCGCTPRITRN